MFRTARFPARLSLSQMRAGMDLSAEVAPRLHLSLRGAYGQGATRDDDRVEMDNELYDGRPQVAFRGGDFGGHLGWTPSRGRTLARRPIVASPRPDLDL